MIFAILSVPLMIIGVMLYKFEMVELLAGYDKEKVADKTGLARWTGGNIFLMGFTVAAIASVFYFLNIQFEHTPIIYMAIILILVARILHGIKRYEV